MISKCANPTCSTPFHYLRDGKVFRVDLSESNDPNFPFLVNGKKATRRTEHFWLCGVCSRTLSLVFDKEKGITVVDKVRLKMRRAAAS
jgi:hypothetical protein